ncbi:hypothetical protein AB1L42_09945 [Thalassoglobus sp. JC818]|uniref:hypothetical protein n=1 Tax=Thalassoglobus sp. JC818 TaxID=3232136 RepID=UPI0034585210
MSDRPADYPVPFDSEDDQRLQQASEIFTMLQTQMDELDRKERSVSEALSLLADRESTLAKRTRSLEVRERALITAEQRSSEILKLAKVLQAKENEIASEKKNLEIQKVELLDSHKRQVAESLRELEEKFQQQQSAAEEQLDQQRRQLNDREQFLQREREEHLKSSSAFRLEMEQQRADLLSEHERILAEKQRELETEFGQRVAKQEQELQRSRFECERDTAELKRQQAEHQQAVEKFRDESASQRAKLVEDHETQLAHHRRLLETEFAEKQSAATQELAKERARLQFQREEIEAESDRHRQAVAQWEKESAEQRTAWEAACDRQIAEEKEKLESEFEELRSEFAKRHGEKESHLAERELQFERDREDFQKAVSEWEAESAKQREQLETLRAHQLEEVRQEVEKEFERRQLELDQLQASIADERQCFEQEKTQWAANLKQRGKSFEAELEARRHELEDFAASQLQESQLQLQFERVRLNQERNDLNAETKRFQQTLNQQRMELNEELKSLRIEFDKSLEQKESEFNDQQRARREELFDEVRRHKKDVEDQLKAEREQLEQTTSKLNADRERFRSHVDEAMARLAEEEQLQRVKTEQFRTQKIAALDLREQQLQQREIDFKKRTTLHESHLDRVRRELETSKAKLEQTRQKQMIWREEVEQGIRLRLSQMRRYRDVMSLREQSLDQEREEFSESRRKAEFELAEGRKMLAEERFRWLQQKAISTTKLQELDSEIHDEYRTVQQLISQFVELTAPESEYGANASSSLFADSVTSIQISNLFERLRETHQLIQHRIEHSTISETDETDQSSTFEAVFEDLSQQVESVRMREEELASAREQWLADRHKAEHVIRELVIQLESALDQIEQFEQQAEGGQLHLGPVRGQNVA